MNKNARAKVLPSPTEIQAEAEWIEEMIKSLTKRINASDCSLKTIMQLEVCRAELHAYWAGLSYALGYTELFDCKDMIAELDLTGVRHTPKC